MINGFEFLGFCRENIALTSVIVFESSNRGNLWDFSSRFFRTKHGRVQQGKKDIVQYTPGHRLLVIDQFFQKTIPLSKTKLFYFYPILFMFDNWPKINLSIA